MIVSRVITLWLIMALFVPSFGKGGSAEDLRQAQLDLSNDGVVMDVSAHPDDEDLAALAYYRMKLGVKTYSVFFTRGEGGQNEIGPELYEELGVIRSRETHEAARILGSEVQFLNFRDFGFSKTASEAIRMWGGEEEVLRRLVYVVRKFKPDVIFSNHSTGKGHGQHQAVAVTAIAAFDAAADPTMFPEQLTLPGITLWQPRKLYFRISPRDEGKPDVRNNVVEAVPGSDESYVRLAARAVTMHKSQGLTETDLLNFFGGTNAYRLIRENSSYRPDTTSFFGGIDFFRDPAVAPLREMRARIDDFLRASGEGVNLTQALSLLSGIRALDVDGLSPVAERIVGRWEEELETVIRTAAGIRLTFLADDSIAVAGQEIGIRGGLESAKTDVRLDKATLSLRNGWRETGEVEVKDNRWSAALSPSEESVPTIPAVSAQYNPVELDTDLDVELSVTLDGQPLLLHDRVSVQTANALEFSISPQRGWIRTRSVTGGTEFRFRVVNRRPHKTAGTIRCETPEGWTSDMRTFTIGEEDGIGEGTILVRPPVGTAAGEYELGFVTDGFRATARAVIFDADVSPGMNIGIVESYDTTLQWAARSLGVPYTMITNVGTVDLAPFTSIILDIRSYAAREDLRANNARLLDYARNGGNLIVMYHKSGEWKPEYAPFPFAVSRSRVTDEAAPVTILEPNHPLLREPNQIGEEDWSGWVQERGIYFPTDVPAQYTRLLSCGDPDEEPLDTGYLVASVGSGSYIYTSYIWYRQMMERHKGAIKCFANMISYPRYRIAKSGE